MSWSVGVRMDRSVERVNPITESACEALLVKSVPLLRETLFPYTRTGVAAAEAALTAFPLDCV